MKILIPWNHTELNMNDTVFNEFKDRKLSEGKHYRVTLGHVAKKLVHVIYYLLKTNSEYKPSKVA